MRVMKRLRRLWLRVAYRPYRFDQHTVLYRGDPLQFYGRGYVRRIVDLPGAPKCDLQLCSTTYSAYPVIVIADGRVTQIYRNRDEAIAVMTADYRSLPDDADPDFKEWFRSGVAALGGNVDLPNGRYLTLRDIPRGSTTEEGPL